MESHLSLRVIAAARNLPLSKALNRSITRYIYSMMVRLAFLFMPLGGRFEIATILTISLGSVPAHIDYE